MAAVPASGPAAGPFQGPETPEAQATRALYERYGPQILSFCLNRLGNREEAEDALQSTFLNAFRGFNRGITPEFESAWLYKIAHNVCLTRQRSSWRRGRIESPGDLDAIQDVLPARELDADELIRLPDALEQMPEQQRHALLLREWQGLSYREIAAELELSQSAVETLLFRARRSLARGLEDEQRLPLRRRLSAGGNAGTAVAVVKALFLGGGAKIAATVATVAATSVVAATPAVRHDLAHALAESPQPAPAAPKPAPRHAVVHVVRAAPASVVRQPVRTVAAVAAPAHVHRVAARHVVAHRAAPVVVHAVAAPKPAPVPPPPPAPAPAPQSAVVAAEPAPPPPPTEPDQSAAPAEPAAPAKSDRGAKDDAAPAAAAAKPAKRDRGAKHDDAPAAASPATAAPVDEPAAAQQPVAAAPTSDEGKKDRGRQNDDAQSPTPAEQAPVDDTPAAAPAAAATASAPQLPVRDR